MIKAQFFCSYCQRMVVATRPEANHGAHILFIILMVVLGFVTCGATWPIAGFWFVIWMLGTILYALHPLRCTLCGSTQAGSKKLFRQMAQSRVVQMAPPTPPIAVEQAPRVPETNVPRVPLRVIIGKAWAIAVPYARKSFAPFMSLTLEMQIATVSTAVMVAFVVTLIVLSR